MILQAFTGISPLLSKISELAVNKTLTRTVVHVGASSKSLRIVWLQSKGSSPAPQHGGTKVTGPTFNSSDPRLEFRNSVRTGKPEPLNTDVNFFTDSSLQASQQGTKTQGVTKEEEKRRIETKESDTSTTRPRYETSFNE